MACMDKEIPKYTPFVSTEDQVKQNIYAFCEANLYTYSAFSKDVGINKNIIYPFMGGKRSITLSTLEKIERFIYDFTKRD